MYSFNPGNPSEPRNAADRSYLVREEEKVK